jgi:hypothetical protein
MFTMGKEVFQRNIINDNWKRYPNNSPNPTSKPYDYREETKTHFTSSPENPVALRMAILSIFSYIIIQKMLSKTSYNQQHNPTE